MSNNNVVDERKGAMKRAVNLITDMSVNGATPEELERAILWSADVVRSNKENVDWKQSYEDYVIADLEDKYQGPDFNDDCYKNYLVFDESYRDPRIGIGKGIFLAGFDTKEEAEFFVKKMNKPNLVIFGPKQK